MTTPDVDFPDLDDVDAKLLKLAKERGLRILTTDFNLNRLARIQDVDVLNVNELANALKPAVLPGESFDVRVIREGKEHDQGVGYLDDGTMVVVEGGRKLMGETAAVQVTSVLQSPSGKMIFTRVSAERGREMSATWAIVVAGGDGARLGADRPKAFVGCGGRPLLAHSIDLLEDHPAVDRIVLVVPAEWEEPATLLADELAAGKVTAAVSGGETRALSVAAGLDEVPADAGADPGARRGPPVRVAGADRPPARGARGRTTASCRRCR